MILSIIELVQMEFAKLMDKSYIFQYLSYMTPLMTTYRELVAIVIILMVLLSSILIYHAFRPYIKLRLTGLPFPHPVYPFFGNFFTIYRHGFQGAHEMWLASLGRCYAVAQSQDIVVAVFDPSLLKQILVKHFATFTNRRTFPVVNQRLCRSLFLSHDEEWKTARRIIMPTFTRHKMRTHVYPHVMRSAVMLADHLNGLVPSFATKNGPASRVCAKKHFGCFTMDAIASTAFGLNLDTYADRGDRIFAKNAKKVFGFNIFNPVFAFLTVFPGLAKLLSYLNLNVLDTAPINFYADVVKEAILKRRKLGIKRNDYLQLLIEANDGYDRSSSGDSIKMTESNGGILKLTKTFKNRQNITFLDEMGHEEKQNIEKPEAENMTYITGKQSSPDLLGFSDEDVLANSMLFFLAGYETSANALCWTAHKLAWYPDVQDQIRRELWAKLSFKTNALEGKGISLSGSGLKKAYKHLTYDDIMDLSYLDCVIKEILRLHPPALVFDRVASEDVTLDVGQCFKTSQCDKKDMWNFGCQKLGENDSKLTIKKGTIVEVPVYALHRDKDLWSDPDIFNPNRWRTAEGISCADYQYQFMPFGFGPRNCVGFRFALLEIKVALVSILGSGLRFIPAEGDTLRDLTPDNTEFRVTGFNIPITGIFFGLTREDRI